MTSIRSHANSIGSGSESYAIARPRGPGGPPAPPELASLVDALLDERLRERGEACGRGGARAEPRLAEGDRAAVMSRVGRGALVPGLSAPSAAPRRYIQLWKAIMPGSGLSSIEKAPGDFCFLHHSSNSSNST